MTRRPNMWLALATPPKSRPGSGKPPAPPRHRAPPTPAPAPKMRVAIVPVEVVEMVQGNPWHLTPREMECLHLAVRGMKRPQIAEEMVVSVVTVSSYLASMRTKMKVDTTAQAVYTWHQYHRVIHADPSENKDETLIANLARAVASKRADDALLANLSAIKKEAA